MIRFNNDFTRICHTSVNEVDDEVHLMHKLFVFTVLIRPGNSGAFSLSFLKLLKPGTAGSNLR